MTEVKVSEPYTVPPKIPTAGNHARSARGFTMVQSFYQTSYGPFQMLLVGDPQCCPYGEFPEFQVSGLSDGDTITGDFEIVIEENSGSAEVSHYEVFYDGLFVSRVASAGTVLVETDAMRNRQHDLRVVGASRSPTANKKSHSIGFVVNQQVTIQLPELRFKLGHLHVNWQAIRESQRLARAHIDLPV